MKKNRLLQPKDAQHRLSAAAEITRQIFESRPAGYDVFPGMAIASAWTVLCLAYSGIEQTLKCLIACAQCNQESRSLTSAGHNLGLLFDCLDDEARAFVEREYRVFRSLHDYIEGNTAAGFLCSVSGGGNQGYTTWRYCLTESASPPTNSPDAMLAIWHACAEVLERRVAEPAFPLPGTYTKRLRRELEKHLTHAKRSVQREFSEAGTEPPRLSDQIHEWGLRHGAGVTAMANVLWCYSRYGDSGQQNISDELERTLSVWAENVLRSPKVKLLHPVRQFVLRSTARAFSWNGEKSYFVSDPWPLETVFTKEPPPNTFEPEDRHGPLWSELWCASRADDCRVLENREGCGEHEPAWTRVLCVETQDAQPLISLWQRAVGFFGGPLPYFRVQRHCDHSALPVHLRQWSKNWLLDRSAISVST